MCGKPIKLDNTHYPCCSAKCEQEAMAQDEANKTCPFCTHKSLVEISKSPTILECKDCGQRSNPQPTSEALKDSWKKPKRLKRSEEKRNVW
jgi:ribosomal protein L37AE/L43A